MRVRVSRPSPSAKIFTLYLYTQPSPSCIANYAPAGSSQRGPGAEPVTKKLVYSVKFMTLKLFNNTLLSCFIVCNILAYWRVMKRKLGAQLAHLGLRLRKSKCNWWISAGSHVWFEIWGVGPLTPLIPAAYGCCLSLSLCLSADRQRRCSCRNRCVVGSHINALSPLRWRKHSRKHSPSVVSHPPLVLTHSTRGPFIRMFSTFGRTGSHKKEAPQARECRTTARRYLACAVR